MFSQTVKLALTLGCSTQWDFRESRGRLQIPSPPTIARGAKSGNVERGREKKEKRSKPRLEDGHDKARSLKNKQIAYMYHKSQLKSVVQLVGFNYIS